MEKFQNFFCLRKSTFPLLCGRGQQTFFPHTPPATKEGDEVQGGPTTPPPPLPSSPPGRHHGHRVADGPRRLYRRRRRRVPIRGPLPSPPPHSHTQHLPAGRGRGEIHKKSSFFPVCAICLRRNLRITLFTAGFEVLSSPPKVYFSTRKPPVVGVPQH